LTTFVTPVEKDGLKSLRIDDVCNTDAAQRLNKRPSRADFPRMHMLFKLSTGNRTLLAPVDMK
jgi:hypothetical protein